MRKLYKQVDTNFSNHAHKKLITDFEKVETEKIKIGKPEEFDEIVTTRVKCSFKLLTDMNT